MNDSTPSTTTSSSPDPNTSNQPNGVASLGVGASMVTTTAQKIPAPTLLSSQQQATLSNGGTQQQQHQQQVATSSPTNAASFQANIAPASSSRASAVLSTPAPPPQSLPNSSGIVNGATVSSTSVSTSKLNGVTSSTSSNGVSLSLPTMAAAQPTTPTRPPPQRTSSHDDGRTAESSATTISRNSPRRASSSNLSAAAIAAEKSNAAVTTTQQQQQGTLLYPSNGSQQPQQQQHQNGVILSHGENGVKYPQEKATDVVEPSLPPHLQRPQQQQQLLARADSLSEPLQPAAPEHHPQNASMSLGHNSSKPLAKEAGQLPPRPAHSRIQSTSCLPGSAATTYATHHHHGGVGATTTTTQAPAVGPSPISPQKPPQAVLTPTSPPPQQHLQPEQHMAPLLQSAAQQQMVLPSPVLPTPQQPQLISSSDYMMVVPTSAQQQPSTQPQQPLTQQHLVSAAPAASTIVGMVGSTPIVRMSQGTTTFIKKKKGRFHLLQEVPVTATTATMGSGGGGGGEVLADATTAAAVVTTTTSFVTTTTAATTTTTTTAAAPPPPCATSVPPAIVPPAIAFPTTVADSSLMGANSVSTQASTPQHSNVTSSSATTTATVSNRASPTAPTNGQLASPPLSTAPQLVQQSHQPAHHVVDAAHAPPSAVAATQSQYNNLSPEQKQASNDADRNYSSNTAPTATSTRPVDNSSAAPRNVSPPQSHMMPAGEAPNNGPLATNVPPAAAAAPSVRKKGRFVITSVTDPSLLSQSTQMVPITLTAAPTMIATIPGQPTTSQEQPPNAVVGDLRSSTGDHHPTTTTTTTTAGLMYAPTQTVMMTNGTTATLVPQQVLYTATTAAPPQPTAPPLQQHHQQQDQQQQQQQQGKDISTDNKQQQQQQQSNQSSIGAGQDNKQPPRQEQQEQSTTGRYKPRQNLASQKGLGKVFYFLDQMRSEVLDADRTIKSLQSEMKSMQNDMRFLKEKNKELEAKARDAERKFHEERGLREAAEKKLKALKKMIRENGGEPITNTVAPPNGAKAASQDSINTASSKRMSYTDGTSAVDSAGTVHESWAAAAATVATTDHLNSSQTLPDLSFTEPASSSGEFEPPANMASAPATIPLKSQQQWDGASDTNSTIGSRNNSGHQQQEAHKRPSTTTLEDRHASIETSGSELSSGSSHTDKQQKFDLDVPQAKSWEMNPSDGEKPKLKRPGLGTSKSEGVQNHSSVAVLTSSISSRGKAGIEPIKLDANPSEKTASGSTSQVPSTISPLRDTNHRERTPSLTNGNSNKGSEHRTSTLNSTFDSQQSTGHQQQQSFSAPMPNSNSLGRNSRIGAEDSGRQTSVTQTTQGTQKSAAAASEFDPLLRSESTRQLNQSPTEGTQFLQASTTYQPAPFGDIGSEQMYQQTQLPVLMMDQQTMAYPIVSLANVEGMSIPTQPFMQMPVQQQNSNGTTTRSYQDFPSGMFFVQQTDLPQNSMMTFQQPIFQWQGNLTTPQDPTSAATIQPSWQFSQPTWQPQAQPQQDLNFQQQQAQPQQLQYSSSQQQQQQSTHHVQQQHVQQQSQSQQHDLSFPQQYPPSQQHQQPPQQQDASYSRQITSPQQQQPLVQQQQQQTHQQYHEVNYQQIAPAQQQPHVQQQQNHQQYQEANYQQIPPTQNHQNHVQQQQNHQQYQEAHYQQIPPTTQQHQNHVQQQQNQQQSQYPTHRPSKSVIGFDPLLVEQMSVSTATNTAEEAISGRVAVPSASNPVPQQPSATSGNSLNPFSDFMCHSGSTNEHGQT